MKLGPRIVVTITSLLGLVVATLSCGPTLQPTVRAKQLPTGDETARSAAEAAEKARESGESIILYATNFAEDAGPAEKPQEQPAEQEPTDEKPSDKEPEEDDAEKAPGAQTEEESAEKPDKAPTDKSRESTGDE